VVTRLSHAGETELLELVGVPVIAPVDVLRERPVGRAGVTDQV